MACHVNIGWANYDLIGALNTATAFVLFALLLESSPTACVPLTASQMITGRLRRAAY